MADNITLDTMTGGSVVAADDRSSVFYQRVLDVGSSAIANNQVAPTASAATLRAADATRKHLTLYNGTNMTVFVGVATVTTANGFAMPPGSSLDLDTTALIQQIVATVTGLTGTMYYIETID